jgi:hypothetical protein
MKLFSWKKKPAEPTPDAPLAQRPDASVKDGDLVTPMKLDDFLTQVAVLLRLPPRALSRAAAPLAAVAEAARRVKEPVTRWGLPAGAVVMVGIFAATKFNKAEPMVVPPQMFGSWTTQQGQYKGRHFTITREMITLSEGRDARDVTHKILSFTATDRRDTTLVTLTYDTDGKPTPMGFRYTSGGRPAIVLDHPWDIVWYRVQDDTTTKVAGAPATP